MLLYYALFLAGSGGVGFALSGFQSKARTSLIMGLGTAAVVALLSFLHSSTFSRKVRHTARHVSPIVVFLFACVFAWRAHLVVGVAGKSYLLFLLGAMAIASIFVFIALLIQHAEDNDRVRLADEKRKK